MSMSSLFGKSYNKEEGQDGGKGAKEGGKGETELFSTAGDYGLKVLYEAKNATVEYVLFKVIIGVDKGRYTRDWWK